MSNNLNPGVAAFSPPRRSSIEDPESYEIERLLGRGGFGEVYLARFRGRQGFTRQVALKVLRSDVDHQDELARRVRDEARLLGLVHHRAVVGVDRLIQIQGRSAIVMEYVDGVSLDALVRVAPLPLAVALEIVAEVCRALHHCWTAAGPDGAPLHLLHRDIKPSNILLTRQGDVKLLDFGIAHAAFDGRESETRSLVFGSPGYMAPERFELQCEAPADIYALGVVLFEVLTRRRFGRTSANPVRHTARVEENLAHLVALRPDAAALVPTLREVFASDPAERPEATALERRVTDLLVGAPEPRLIRWAAEGVPAVAIATVEEESTGASEGGAGWTGQIVSEERSTLAARRPDDFPETCLVALDLPGSRRPARRRAHFGLLLLALMLGVLAATWWFEPGPDLAQTQQEPPATPAQEVTSPTVADAAATTAPPSNELDLSSIDTGRAGGLRVRQSTTTAARSPRARSKAHCEAPKVHIESAPGKVVEVQILGDWRPTPVCVDWAPSLYVRNPTEAGAAPDQVPNQVLIGPGRTHLMVACDTQGCRADYNP